MKKQFLFSYRFKKPALVLLMICLSMGVYMTVVDDKPDVFKVKIYDIETGYTLLGKIIEENNLINNLSKAPKENRYYDMDNTIIGSLLILSILFFAFSMEKHEDEYIQKIRLDALLWATYVNYGLLFIAFWLFWGLSFLDVMMYNMFTHLLIFIIVFNYNKYKMKISLSNEE